MKINVSEYFHSIQGEGKTQGINAIFLRLQSCNLQCGGIGTTKDQKLHNGATWRCDTIEVWLKGEAIETSRLAEIFEQKGWLSRLKTGTHLVITGGEPLLQQKPIIEFVKLLEEQYGAKPFLEIETNGTILPTKTMIKITDLFNCSPKLKNSGELLPRRYKPEVVSQLINTHKTIFKFVMDKKEDWEEIKTEWVNTLNIPLKLIYLMPSADNDWILKRNSQIVSEICIQNNINFSNRLQVQLWNKTTGV